MRILFKYKNYRSFFPTDIGFLKRDSDCEHRNKIIKLAKSKTIIQF